MPLPSPCLYYVDVEYFHYSLLLKVKYLKIKRKCLNPLTDKCALCFVRVTRI